MKGVESNGINKGYENAANYRDIDQFMTWLELWKAQADYVMDFDKMVYDPEIVVKEIADKMGLVINVNEVMSELDSLRAPAIGHDPVTFMSEAHYKFIK